MYDNIVAYEDTGVWIEKEDGQFEFIEDVDTATALANCEVSAIDLDDLYLQELEHEGGFV